MRDKVSTLQSKPHHMARHRRLSMSADNLDRHRLVIILMSFLHVSGVPTLSSD